MASCRFSARRNKLTEVCLGVNEILPTLLTEEGKAACLIRITAIVLSQVSRALGSKVRRFISSGVSAY